MLLELSIRNFALIDELRLSFPEGLNLITGETGAGKSIIIEALTLALGGRAAGQDLIRTGADRCSVEATFDLRDAPGSTVCYLEQEGLLDSDQGEDANLLLVSRELTRSGKNQCRINGRLMPVSALRDATYGLVDVHGQHEHQTLLSPARHLDLLDSWLGDKVTSLRKEVSVLHAAAGSLRLELVQLRESAKERARNLDLYQFQQQEIDDAHLLATEENEMATERIRLVNAEKLHAFADEAYQALNDAALDGLNSAASAAQRGSAIDPQLEAMAAQINEALVAADEARRGLRSYRDGVEFNPRRIEEIEERLATIRALKRKYGESIEEILAYAADLESKLRDLESSDEREAQIERDVDRAERELASLAERLSGERRNGSRSFGESIVAELRDLGMPQSAFEVGIEPQPVTMTGTDRVEFLISANPGEPLKPLAKIASGGELSRIMLALKTVLSRAAYVPTLIFDEIDVGVGGRTAITIGQKLSSLAQNAQVFCITHLPQIASQPAAAHFFIEKQVHGDRTFIYIGPLDFDGRVDEIARMLGGSNRSQTVIQHAKEMLTAPVTSARN